MAKLMNKNGIRILNSKEVKEAKKIKEAKKTKKLLKKYNGAELSAPLAEKLSNALRTAKKAAKAVAKMAKAAKVEEAAEKRKEALKVSKENAKKLWELAFPWVIEYPQMAEEEGLTKALDSLVEITEGENVAPSAVKTVIKATGKSKYNPDTSRVSVSLGDITLEEGYIDGVISTLISNSSKLHNNYDSLEELYIDFPNIPISLIDVNTWYRDATYSVYYQVGNLINIDRDVEGLKDLILRRINEYRREKGRETASVLNGVSKPKLFRHYNIDPAAFKFVDSCLESAGIEPEKGYDGCGVWGLSPADIARAWYNSGCKINGKFKTYIHFEISNLVKHGRVDGFGGSRYLKPAGKKESSTSYFFKMKGMKRIKDRNIGIGDIKRIGRLNWVTAQYALKHCLIEDDSINSRRKRFRVDWAKVAAFSKLDKFTKASYLNPKAAWLYLFNRECPFSISKREANPVFLAKDKVALRTWIKVAKFTIANSASEAERESNLLAAYNLVRVFRDFQTLKRWLKVSGQEYTAMGIHDSFVESKWADKVSNLRQWVTLLNRFPDLSWSIGAAPLFEKEYGRMPNSKKEFVNFVAGLDYKVTTPLEREVSGIASRFKLSEGDFKDYVKFFKKTSLKPASMIPAVEASTEGYRMVKLDDYDKVGPFLGLATNCCQHLHNAASSCAKAGYKDPEAGFYVVYKGDKIIAQSFVWRAKDGSFIFDSIEGFMGYEEIVAKLYQDVSRKLIGKLGIHRVLVGDTNYGITRRVKSLLSGRELSKPVNIYRFIYTDAKKQWIIAE